LASYWGWHKDWRRRPIQTKQLFSAYHWPVASSFLSPRLHTLAIVLLAGVLGGELHAADDLETVEWFPLAGPLPEMAFEADAHICERYYRTRLCGVPVDPRYASGRQ
jgi:hypothetical protein